MKYIFRGNILFEYIPGKGVKETERDHKCMFNYCIKIPEDYRLLSVFFDKVYKHINKEEVVLEDIIVN